MREGRASRRRLGRRAAAACAPLVALAAACGGDGGIPRSLHELERMVFVPAGAVSLLPAFLAPAAEATVAEALLVDRFEATRADWRWYGFAGPDPETWTLERAWAERVADEWPATMSHEEARLFAERRGMRLLRAEEWIYLAVGPRRNKFPWGSTDQRSTANTLELGLGRPLPVGTFENGRSEPFGCYDLLGNVWEWVAGRVPGYADPPGDDLTPPWRVSAMGGSFLSRKRETYGPSTLAGVRRPVFHAVTLDPRHRAPDIGVRCGVEARAYLAARAPEWESVARERLEEVGARWGREAERLLASLCVDPEAPPALRWLLAGARRDG